MVSKTAGADLALAGVTVVWGASFTLVKAALEDVSTILFLAVRFALAAVVLALLYRRRLGAVRTPAALRGGLLAGICLAAAYLLQTAGLRLTTPSRSAFLTALSVAMVPLLASLVYRSAPQPSEAAGVGMALVGMGLMTAAPGAGGNASLGDWLTVGAAVAFAAHIVTVGHYAPRAGFEALSVMQIGVVAAMMLATVGWLETPRLRWSARLAAAWLVTALLCTALAFTVQAWAQQRTTPTRAALIFALEPVVAAATSWIVAGEALGAAAAAGAALILGGVVTAEMKPWKTRGHPS